MSISGMLLLRMFLRSTNRRKDGKDHRYFSVVENRRLPGGKTAQRTVLYLGEINDQQQAAWRKTLDVFDEAEQRYTTMSLFPDDREIPADALDSAQIKLSGLELRRPRAFGNCLAGLRAVAATGAGYVLAGALAEGSPGSELGEGTATAGGESAAGSGQRVSCASAMVSGFGHGSVAGDGLRGGGKGPAVSLPGPRAGTQKGIIHLAEAEVGGLVSCRF